MSFNKVSINMNDVLETGVCNVYFPSLVCNNCYLYGVCEKEKADKK